MRSTASEPTSPLASGSAGDLIRRTYAVAKAELERKQAMQSPTSPGMAPAAGASLPASASSRVDVYLPGRRPAAPPPPVTLASTLPHASTSTYTMPPPTAVPSPTTEQLASEMRAMKRMVEALVAQQSQRLQAVPKTSHPDLPDALFDQYLHLLRQEVTEELAEEVVQQVKASLTPGELSQPTIVRKALLDAISKLIPTDETAGMIQPASDGRPRTIALIGPTGVGKTTTVAKLAAILKLKQKKNVALITLDTYRIAAVDQLRTYANIIGLPLHVVNSPEEMREALRRSRDCDAVLIDTAGRSQRDDPKLEQLAMMVRTADPHEVHLVLSSTCTQKVLLETVERFSQIRTDRIIFTKLDEAVSLGVILNVARKANKQLSFVTTGQEVPHHIEPGRRDRLAALVMGEGVGDAV